MRRVALLLTLGLAACGGASKHGPAWPKSAGTVVPDTWQDDGGESIDPRTPNDVEQSDSDVPSESDGDPALGAAVGAAAGGTTVDVTVTPADTDAPPPPPAP